MPQDPAGRTVLSLEAVLRGATEILDADGVPGLTLRRLAALLGTGVASIYWYVQNKDDLVGQAANRALAGPLTALSPSEGGDAIAGLRRVALALYDELDAHPWLGQELTRGAMARPNAALLWELIGQQVATLGLDVRQQFHVVSTLVNYVVGVGTQMATARFVVPAGRSREEHLALMATAWDELDPARFPFTRATADVMRHHDDREQFAAGLELFLGGLQTRTGRAT